ncbi:MAG: exopolysaccharide biosynthesis protein [Cypionkella sp.]
MPPRFSEALSTALAAESGERISLARLAEVLGAQALPALLLICALPNILPSLPGTSAITGLPLVFLSLQLLLGHRLTLPGFLGKRSLPRAGLQKLLAKAEPALRRIEQLLRPRLPGLGKGLSRGLLGALCLLLSALIMLPIPFANILPAVSLLLIALGFLGKDGLCLLTGALLGLGSVAMVLVIYKTLISAALGLWLS